MPWRGQGRRKTWVVAALALALLAAVPALAQQIPFTPQVDIPGSSPEAQADRSGRVVGTTLLVNFIILIYRFGVWLAVTLAVFMMMVGGFLWLIAGGSPQRVENAKSFISSSLIGMVLALTSFLLLQTVNPRLVELSLPEPRAATLTNAAGPAALSPGQAVTARSACGTTPVRAPSECATVCKDAGGPYISDGKPVAIEIVDAQGAKTGEYCCSCSSQPCLTQGKTCDTSNSKCCKPLVCNADEDECLYLQPGGGDCDVDQDCLSGLCYDGWDDSCVPVGGFPDKEDCNRDEECASKICNQDDDNCYQKLKKGGVCRRNLECESGFCNIASELCE